MASFGYVWVKYSSGDPFARTAVLNLKVHKLVIRTRTQKEHEQIIEIFGAGWQVTSASAFQSTRVCQALQGAQPRLAQEKP